MTHNILLHWAVKNINFISLPIFFIEFRGNNIFDDGMPTLFISELLCGLVRSCFHCKYLRYHTWPIDQQQRRPLKVIVIYFSPTLSGLFCKMVNNIIVDMILNITIGHHYSTWFTTINWLVTIVDMILNIIIGHHCQHIVS